MIKKQDPSVCCLQEIYFEYKVHTNLKKMDEENTQH